MTLKDIFDHLAYGELAGYFLGTIDEETGTLTEDNQLKMVSHINAGLAALYTRFTLRKESVRIELSDERTRYPLRKEFAMSSGKPDAFINDLAVPLDHDVLAIQSIYDDKGKPVPINALDSPCSVLTPTPLTMEVPEALKSEFLTVRYKAGPKRLDEFDMMGDPSFTEIALPFVYLEALGYYIASRVLNPTGMQQEMTQGTNYSLKYEAACMLLEQTGMHVQEDTYHPRACRNGWV